LQGERVGGLKRARAERVNQKAKKYDFSKRAALLNAFFPVPRSCASFFLSFFV
jgi:hypothetical protein